MIGRRLRAFFGHEVGDIRRSYEASALAMAVALATLQAEVPRAVTVAKSVEENANVQR